MMSVAVNKIDLQKKIIAIDMKTIGIIGVIIATVGFLVGVYCQIEIIPNFESLDAQYDLSELNRSQWRNLADQKFILGSVALFLGFLAAVMGLIIIVKKQKIGWIIIGIGLISFILGAIQSTHMFS